jgi:transcriptional regulator with XRE-family HTH domain
MATEFDGLELKIARIRAKVKQKDIARAIGMAASMLCMIENGERPAKPEEIKRIKQALKARGVKVQ